MAVGVGLWVSELHADLEQTLKTQKQKRWAPAVNITLVMERKGTLNAFKLHNQLRLWERLSKALKLRPALKDDKLNSNK